MTYPRNRTRDLRLTAEQYRRHRYRVARRIGFVVLVVAMLLTLWAWMRPAQADFTDYVDRDPWRCGIVGGFDMVESPRLPALAWTPPGEPSGKRLAALDAWLDERPLRSSESWL